MLGPSYDMQAQLIRYKPTEMPDAIAPIWGECSPYTSITQNSFTKVILLGWLPLTYARNRGDDEQCLKLRPLEHC